MFLRKWGKAAQADFLIRIGQCLEKGYRLAEAIHLQSFQQKPFIKTKIEKMLVDLSSGNSIAEALRKADFPKEICGFLFFSEQVGDLEQGFRECGRLLKRRVEQRQKLDSLLRYPLFLLWLFAVMGYIVLHYLLPSFEQLYDAMSIDLPFFIKGIIHATRHTGVVLTFMAAAGCLLTFIILYIRRLPPESRVGLIIKLPVITTFIRLYLTYSFSFHLGGLLRIGMSVDDALNMIASQTYVPFFRAEALAIRDHLIKGRAFADIIGERGFYTKDLAVVIHHGEIRGRLGQTLFDYSDMVFRRFDEKIMRILSIIQPAFFIGFGALIISLFVSILMPMFTIMNGL
ncbi:competence type IV pilus assembly protein ComGB [Camelliibacillus cellulosilyticus]|uniref:Competence type IV pilus assembly protein ComGB n=1 Tax=Camelliibacillus cellulosilyticus TaxID=2174486 RepID=A0ABV9GI63_9BACL